MKNFFILLLSLPHIFLLLTLTRCTCIIVYVILCCRWRWCWIQEATISNNPLPLSRIHSSSTPVSSYLGAIDSLLLLLLYVYLFVYIYIYMLFAVSIITTHRDNFIHVFLYDAQRSVFVVLSSTSFALSLSFSVHVVRIANIFDSICLVHARKMKD